MNKWEKALDDFAGCSDRLEEIHQLLSNGVLRLFLQQL